MSAGSWAVFGSAPQVHVMAVVGKHFTFLLIVA